MSDSRIHAKIQRGLRDRARRAEALVDALTVTVAEQNRMLLGIVLRDVLENPDDFERFVELADLVTPSGALDWNAVDRELDRLVDERPYLASPTSENPWRSGRRALSWFATDE